MKQLHTYINKHDEVKESIFDDEDIMDRMDDQIKVIEWLAEHTNHNFKKDEAMRMFNKVIKFNADGSFDLPDSYTTIKEKSYTFTLDSELPSYVKFNNLGNRYNIFDITVSGSFKTTGFPKDFTTEIKLLGNCTINAMKADCITIAEGTCGNVDLFIMNTTADHVWMDKYAAILNAELNTLNRKCKNSHTIFHNIPFHIYNLNMSILGLEYLLKEHGVISWSSNLIKK